MTRDEVKKLLVIMASTFPNYRLENIEHTISTWQMLLEDYSANDVFLAFKSYCKNSNSGFAPSVPQLIGQLEKPKDLAEMDEAAAWDLVRKAIMRSTYHSHEEFEHLPPAIKRAVGSANMLYCWATDENYSDSVVSSQFKRSYRQICQRKKDYERLPKELQERVNQFIEKSPTTNDGTVLIDSSKVEDVLNVDNQDL